MTFLFQKQNPFIKCFLNLENIMTIYRKKEVEVYIFYSFMLFTMYHQIENGVNWKMHHHFNITRRKNTPN